jgi:carbon monoxide dehydrogenase subunit G
MTISAELELGYEFTVKAPIKQVYDLVSDVPRSVSHFPKVEKLDDLGGGVYRWEMEKVGTPQVYIQTMYASRYVCDRKKGSVVWTPVEGQGNALVGGSWKLSTTKKGTKLELRIHGVAEVPLPALMKVVVVPVVQAEFEKLVEAYIDNLIREFGGEV